MPEDSTGQLTSFNQKTAMTTKRKTQVLTIEQQKAFRKLEREAIEFDTGKPGYCTDEPENDLGKRLEYQRTAKSLTQGQLAELTKLADETGKGLSRSVISLYELGINRPGIREVRILCEVLRISPSYLIYGDDEPFEVKANSQHFGGIADSEPEFLARAVYCLYRLDSEHSIPLVEMMIGMLQNELTGFENLMEYHADRVFLDIAKDLQGILKEKKKKAESKEKP